VDEAQKNCQRCVTINQNAGVFQKKNEKKTQINKNSQKIFRLPLTVRFHQRQSGNKLTANRPLAKYTTQTHSEIIFQSDNREIYKGTGSYTEKKYTYVYHKLIF